jgi:hypothetical protein
MIVAKVSRYMSIMLTCRTLIELLEYVRRKAILPGPSVSPLLIRALLAGEDMLGGLSLDGRPLDELEDSVSRESVPFSSELDISGGSGGTSSAGASIPFFVVEVEREPSENKPLALGAEATRRIKRDAVAPIDLGDRGPLPRDFEGVVGVAKDACDGLAVRGFARGWLGLRERVIVCFSDLVCGRGLPEGPIESASVDWGCCCCW